MMRFLSLVCSSTLLALACFVSSRSVLRSCTTISPYGTVMCLYLVSSRIDGLWIAWTSMDSFARTTVSRPAATDAFGTRRDHVTRTTFDNSKILNKFQFKYVKPSRSGVGASLL